MLHFLLVTASVFDTTWMKIKHLHKSFNNQTVFRIKSN